MSKLHVVIVGGGASGALLALALADRLHGGCCITMFDREGRFGRGIAYSATAPWHRINVSAAKMGGHNDSDPSGFVDWLAQRGHLRTGDYSASFVPRAFYGDYLCDLLAGAAATGALVMRQGAVIALEPHARGYVIRTDTGEQIESDVVALCLGNPPPPPMPSVPISERWVADVWRPDALDRIAPQDHVLLIGSGATAVDVALDLAHRAVGRHITMVSRKGLVPRRDAPPTDYSGFQPLDLEAPTMRRLLRLLRSEIERAAAAGIPWQSVLDAFRAHYGTLWERSNAQERGRFLRHLRSLWLVHRHRLAPDVSDLLARLQSDGILSVIAGRLVQAEPTAAGSRLDCGTRGRNARVHGGLDHQLRRPRGMLPTPRGPFGAASVRDRARAAGRDRARTRCRRLRAPARSRGLRATRTLCSGPAHARTVLGNHRRALDSRTRCKDRGAHCRNRVRTRKADGGRECDNGRHNRGTSDMIIGIEFASSCGVHPFLLS
jgi:uncharacterized NAD(P)/FAD-binding protein YdhS